MIGVALHENEKKEWTAVGYRDTAFVVYDVRLERLRWAVPEPK